MAVLIMADPDYPVTSAHQTYWKALGRFIHRYAMMEQQIHYLLQLYSRTSPPISQALFSGTRARQALSWVDRLREVAGEAKDEDFDRAKSQFGLITTMRDDIVHNGALLYAQGFLISNRNRTIPRQQRITPISAKDLNAMSADLNTIAATIFCLQVSQEGGLMSSFATDWRQVGRAAWRYKSPAPVADVAGSPHRFEEPSSQRKVAPPKHQRKIES